MTSPLPLVPLNDLARGTAALRTEIDAAISRVLDSGWFVLGPEHDALETELADYLGVGAAVLVANGTDALQLALRAVGVLQGGLVLTAANAGGYTTTATLALGAQPLFADVDSSMLVTAQTLDEAVTRAPRLPDAVVVTHLYGAVADMTSIMAWARGRGIAVVEDCAQAIGATHAGRRAGSFGDVATLSFYPTKNLGALGDGGAVLTSDPDAAVLLRRLRQYGWESKYHVAVPGGRNSRMDEMQAAIVRVKLPHLDAWTQRRRAVHEQYEAACGAGARMVGSVRDAGFVAHLAVVETDRERARAVFDAAGVRTEVHYPVPDHRQPTVDFAGSLPTTERAVTRILSVPLFPELTDTEVTRVTDALSLLSWTE